MAENSGVMKTLMTQRAQEIAAKIAALQSRSKIRIGFAPSSETDFIRYFPSDLHCILATNADDRFEVVTEGDPSAVDVLIITAHGANLANAIWGLRAQGADCILAVWFWDNHIAHLNNMRTALAADLVFPSHKYVAQYLLNPLSALGPHVPACSAQWGRAEAAELFERHSSARSDKLNVHYVDYPLSQRSLLLRALRAEMKEADVRLMDPGDRSAYFSKSRAERFKEWLCYKVSLVLPVDRDLSTRVFDGLLAGHVLLVPRDIPDFDEVIPPPAQLELGIVRFETSTVAQISQAHRQALAIFDKQGGGRHRKAPPVCNG